MNRLLIPLTLLLAAVLAVPAEARAPEEIVPATPGTSLNFELVGHDPLFNRGMNSATAMYRHFIYVSNRSDGSAGRPPLPDDEREVLAEAGDGPAACRPATIGCRRSRVRLASLRVENS